MGVDMHGPRYGWSMRQGLAMLLVPDNNDDDEEQGEPVPTEETMGQQVRQVVTKITT